MTKELRIMVGLPGSGKSTFAKQEAARLEEEKYTTAIVSRDEVRFSMVGENEGYFSKEKAVFKEFTRQINECMELGIDIVFVDATHLNSASRKKLLRNLNLDSETCVIFEVINTPLDECIRRNNLREGRSYVPETVIKNMSTTFSLPSTQECDAFGIPTSCVRVYM